MKLKVHRADGLILGFLLSLALAAALASWLSRPSRKTGGLDEQPSTFFTEGYGTRALYQVLERLGLRPARLRRPITAAALAGRSALVILRPVLAIEAPEREALLAWVEAGNRLLISPDRSLLDLARRRSARGEEPWFSPAGGVREAAEPVPVTIAGDLAAAEDPLLSGVREIRTRPVVRFRTGDFLRGPLAGLPAEEVLKEEDGVALARIPLGRGRIIVLGDTYPLSNSGLGQADNDLLALNLLWECAGEGDGPVLFDEYHLGFVERDPSWLAMAKLLLTDRWGFALAQAALAGALAVAALGIRFGRPQGVAPASRRHHREFAEAAGRLLAEARGEAVVRETLLGHYRGRLRELVRLPPSAGDGEIATAVMDQSGIDVRVALGGGAAGARRPRPRPADLLGMARALHRAVEAMEHGN